MLPSPLRVSASCTNPTALPACTHHPSSGTGSTAQKTRFPSEWPNSSPNYHGVWTFSMFANQNKLYQSDGEGGMLSRNNVWLLDFNLFEKPHQSSLQQYLIMEVKGQGERLAKRSGLKKSRCRTFRMTDLTSHNLGRCFPSRAAASPRRNKRAPAAGITLARTGQRFHSPQRAGGCRPPQTACPALRLWVLSVSRHPIL